MRVLSGHSKAVTGVAFAPGGEWLVSFGGFECVCVWSRGGERLCDWSMPLATSLAVMPDKPPVVIVATSDGEIHCGEPNTGRCERLTIGDSRATFALAAAPDGSALATVQSGGRYANPAVCLRRWSRDAIGHSRELWPAPKVALFQTLAFSPCGDRLASTHADAGVYLGNLRQGRSRRLWAPANRLATTLAFRPTGTELVVNFGSEACRLDYATQQVQSRTNFVHEIWSLAYAPDGGSFAAGTVDGAVALVGADGAAGAAYNIGAGRVHSLAFAPDGLTLAAGCQDGSVVLIDLDG